MPLSPSWIMTPLYFARITGKNPRKVRYWYDGEEDIPHDVMLICSLLTLPGAKDMASTVTNSVIRFHGEEPADVWPLRGDPGPLPSPRPSRSGKRPGSG